MSKNLYAVRPFHTVSATMIYQPAVVQTLERIECASHPSDRDAIEALPEGQSTIIAIESDGILVKSGYRITRLPQFEMNRVMFDEHAREYVLISNGRCVLNHGPLYQQEHGGSGMAACLFAPSEAIALRVFISNGKATCAWTYRKVNPADLSAISNESEVKAQFEAVLQHKRTARFIGRI